jgi:TRAP-type mannitol/chloroaromatic compound transport system permease small subunit
MKNVVGKIVSLFEKFTKLLTAVSGGMILIMAFIITYSVIMRYVFKDPDPYTFDLTAMICLFTAVLTFPYLEKMDQNIRMDMVVTYIPKIPQYFLMRVLGPLAALYYVTVLSWKGWVNALYSLKIHETSPTQWGQPLAPIKFVIPIGYTLLGLMLIMVFIQGVIKFSELMRERKNPTGSQNAAAVKE